MKLRHDEREAAAAAERKAAEREKRERIAAERAARAALASTPAATSPPGPSHKSAKEPALKLVPTAEAKAKRVAVKEQSLSACREHEAELREKENRRVAMQLAQAEMRELGGKIASGEA